MATNAATYVGFKVGGIWGSFVATVAVSIPSILAMVGLVRFAETRTERRWWKARSSGCGRWWSP